MLIDMRPKPPQSLRARSFGWTLLLAICLFLPYRWLWLPCGLAAALVVRPGAARLREIIARDGTLIVGAGAVLVLRTALDIGWWLPWAGLFVMLCALRGSRVWRPRLGYVLVPSVIAAAFLILARPVEWPASSTRAILRNKDITIVCAGDSLTSGVKPGTDEGTYTARLRERLGCRVINAGVANDRTADLLARLDRTVLRHEAEVVVLFIGGNDYLDGTSRKDFASQLNQAAGRVAASGASLVIVEVPSGIVWDRFAGVYRNVARRHGAVLVPETKLRAWYSVELLLREQLADPLTIDGIHLSATGASRVAEWLAPYVMRAVSQRATRTTQN